MWDVKTCLVTATSWLKATYSGAEARVLDTLRKYAADALRISVGLVFIWFGLLKVFGQSPAASLVTRTIDALYPVHGPLVAALGGVETVIGVALCCRIALRATLVLFVMQQAGTFLVFVVCPDLAFQRHNPLLLTLTGEFVAKNVVLVVACIASVVLEVTRLSVAEDSTSRLAHFSAENGGVTTDTRLASA